MLALYITGLLVAAATAYVFLRGITFWWAKDLKRGFAYVTLSFFILLMASLMFMVSAVSNVMDDKVKEHNLERFFPDQSEITDRSK